MEYPLKCSIPSLQRTLFSCDSKASSGLPYKLSVLCILTPEKDTQMKDNKIHIVCGVIRLALDSLLSWGLSPYH